MRRRTDGQSRLNRAGFLNDAAAWLGVVTRKAGRMTLVR